MNLIKAMSPKIKAVRGAAHTEELAYIFSMEGFKYLYNLMKNNMNDPVNQQTLAAIKFVTALFVEYAKTG